MEEQPDLLDWTPPVANTFAKPLAPEFGGSTYDEARERIRLKAQLERVYSLMLDGKSRTLRRISELTGDPEASVSARLRDLRKEEYGSHLVIREQVKDNDGNGIPGLFAYRLVVPEKQEAA